MPSTRTFRACSARCARRARRAAHGDAAHRREDLAGMRGQIGQNRGLILALAASLALHALVFLAGSERRPPARPPEPPPGPIEARLAEPPPVQPEVLPAVRPETSKPAVKSETKPAAVAPEAR